MWKRVLTYLILLPLVSFSPVPGPPSATIRLDPSRIDLDKVFLLIDKSRYRLYVY
ncbi:MAG: hypothetical protein ACYCOO_03805 [Chitinophagaceae bacterium]